jgi:eukaryotic-like serine/threonine-protein kinase
MKPDPANPPSEPVMPTEDAAPSQHTEDACTQDAEEARIRSQQPPTYPRTPGPTSTQASSTERHATSVPQAPGYRMLREIGRGTYGEVWLAEDIITGGQVAIKFLIASLGEQWERLLGEVKQLSALFDDPGIVQFKDFKPHADRPYYVMAFAEGGSLAQRLKQGAMPLAEALPMFRRIAVAMAYVHAKGIHHCDLKPANILIDKRGRPRVADFGQAHLADDMSPALGTFFFMAPEQAHLIAQEPDPRWDVYALGALFYAMLTGDPPHGEATLKHELAKTEKLPERLRVYREAMAQAKTPVAHRQVPGMDKQLAAIIERCLAFEPAQRYRSAEAVVDALDRRQRRRRQRIILYAGLVVPVLLLLILGFLGWWRASSTLKTAERNLEDQAMKSYTNSAKLAAAKVKDTVEHYIKGIVASSKKEELKKALLNPKLDENPIANNQEINNILEKLWYANPPPLNLNDPVIFWEVLDKKGYLVGYRTPDGIEQEYVGWNFAFRGYFHGDFDDLEALERLKKTRQKGRKDDIPHDREGKEFGPISKISHISDPFLSIGNNLCVSVSTPVKDEKNGAILGVLVVGLDLLELSKWLADIDFADDGFPVLINEDTFVLVHKKKRDDWAKIGNMPKKYGSECPLYLKIVDKGLTDDRTGGQDQFRDPIDNQEYLAGYVAIGFEEPVSKRQLNERWGLLVQVKQAKVTEPAKAAKENMIRWGLIMLTVAILMLVAMWLGLLWMLRREERFAHS